MTLEQYKKKSKKIPDAPGVYFFLNKQKKVLYIGKATSLRDRTRSYFAKDLADTRGPLIVEMVAKATGIDYRVVDSVLEAVLLEASLIRAHKPKYNSIQKDDKSFNHVVITKEEYPRVLVVRGRELAKLQNPEGGFRARRRENLSESLAKDSRTPRGVAEVKLAHIFGPFPHGLQLQEAMKLIRKIFPYRDTCEPAEEALARGKQPKGCFNAHIGLCPGICTGAVGKAEYRRIIRHIVLLFQGKKKQLIKELERDMRRAAKDEAFEEAKRLRGQLFALQHIEDVSLIKDEYRAMGVHTSVRIEAYDVAHLRGESAVGVMTVVEDGLANKNEYRKFRLRAAHNGDDPGALKEILSRRLGHSEWPMPRIIVVDGAAPQINAAEHLLKSVGLGIPVVGVVKDEKHRPRELRGEQAVIRGREKDILLANAEAHRFAIGYHRKTSRRNLTL